MLNQTLRNLFTVRGMGLLGPMNQLNLSSKIWWLDVHFLRHGAIRGAAH